MNDIVWTAAKSPTSDQFVEYIKLSMSFLQSGNFPQAQAYISKAINTRLLLKGLTERREADRFLFGVISPMLANFGFKLKENALLGTITFEKISVPGSSSWLTAGILLSVLGGTFYFVYKQIKNKKK